jgi:hypothetical protein
MEEVSYKIGQHLKLTEERKFKTAISEEEVIFPAGTEVFISAHRQYIFPNEKIAALPENAVVKGYDQDGITEIILRKLKRNLPVSEMMEDYDITDKDIKDAILDALDYLWIM